MRVIYFTTSVCENDYPSFINIWKIPLNSSNQNFHSKMIRSIGKKIPVEVISMRPFSKRKCRVRKLSRGTTIKDNIVYHYLSVTMTNAFRVTSFKRQAYRIVKDLDLEEPTILVSDTINPKAIKVANYIKSRFNIPLVGLCTDSPSNISGTNRSYTVFLLKQTADLDGYISLTRELNELFNVKQKPSIILEGLVEDKLPEPIKNQYGKYFFFGGALLKRYGVYDLINSFKKLPQKDINLLICGHHADEETIKKTIGKDSRIHYLKLLPIRKTLQLEMNALANINPRPYSEDLDRFSIPSKTLEYLNSGRPTISVKNTKLQKRFQEDIIWCKSSSEEELLTAMNRLLALSPEEQKALGEKAKEKVSSLYSLSVVSEQLQDFLTKFVN